MGKRKSDKIDAIDAGVEPDVSASKHPKDKKEKKHKKNKKDKTPSSEAANGRKADPAAVPVPTFDSDLANIFASAAASNPAPPPPRVAVAQTNSAPLPSQETEPPSPEPADEDDEGLDEKQLAEFREELGLGEGEMPIGDQGEKEKEADEDDNTTSKVSKKKAIRVAPLTPEQRQRQDARTIFLGNVPLSALSSHGVQRQLRAHLVSVLPGLPKAAIESIRFRSIPFSVPTADYTTGTSSAAEAAALERKNERSRLHRQQLVQADFADKGLNPNAVQFLRPSQKRKVAAIKQDVNSQASSCNCYVVIHPAVAWMNPDTVTESPSEPNDEELENKEEGGEDKQDNKVATSNATAADTDPNASKRARIVAAALALLVDGTLFAGKHLRANLTAPLSPEEVHQGQASIARARSGEVQTSPLIAHLADVLSASLVTIPSSNFEPKETVFVGNLDFSASDEDLRAFFEGLVTQERGPPRGTKSWVKSVRIVRDRATQMGKGFGYVRFADEASVDEVMALWDADQARVAAAEAAHRKAGAVGTDGRSRPTVKRTVKFMKRGLRLARCKALRGNGGKTDRPPRSPATPATPNPLARGRSSGAPTPGGSSPWERQRHSRRQLDSSPTRDVRPDQAIESAPPLELGSKEALRAAKKSDPGRQAKRLAKKQKKRLERSVVAATGSASGKIALNQGRRSKASKPGQANKKALSGRKAPSKKASK